MKVCLIGATNLYGMPYMRYYRNILDRLNITYDIVYWDRAGLEEETGANIFSYKKPIKNLPNKIKSLIGYKYFIEKVICDNHYDRIIVMTTMPAVLIANKLIIKYRGNYVVDIRDYTFEHIVPYYNRIRRLTRNSALNVISSPEFKTFLPSAKYLNCHNISFPVDGDRNIRKNKPRNMRKIRISYIGGISYYDQLKAFLVSIGNDERFEMNFFGDGLDSDKIQKFCKSNNFNNVRFYGRYAPVEKESFYGQTDIIYNIYGNNTTVTKYALSNKLYDSAWYYVPILVSPYTAMEQYSNGFGITVNLEEPGIGDKIASCYNNIQWGLLEKECDSFISKALKENKYFQEKLMSFLEVIQTESK
jgi:hypothetical protein